MASSNNGVPSANGTERKHSEFVAPIAVCGVGLRLPGGIHDCNSFWDFLVEGKDAQTAISPTRYNISGFDDALDGKNPIGTRNGYFLAEDLAAFDGAFFSMTKAEVEKCDPQQRKLLEVTRECLEDAGETNYRGQNIGCYIGNFGQDWMEMSLKEPQHAHNYTTLGYTDFMLANRVTYEFDLQGPRCGLPDKSLPLSSGRGKERVLITYF